MIDKTQLKQLQEAFGESEDTVPHFLSVESRVFTCAKDGTIYIGKEKITNDLKATLKDDARFFEKSRLWEILNASAINEAYNLALLQSKDFEQVQFAKALKHWTHFMLNVIHTLLESK